MNAPAIAITPGDPAGIGPDLVVTLAQESVPAALIAIADADLLAKRAQALGLTLKIRDAGEFPYRTHIPGELLVAHVPLVAPVVPGAGNPKNADYVLSTLKQATAGCLSKRFRAVVTGPVNKAIICQGGVRFSGHTGYLAELANAKTPVMLFETGALRVALLTTHIPLSEVPAAITEEAVGATLRVLDRELRTRFDIESPRISVLGLNPHAGENGLLGHEENEILAPAIAAARAIQINANGPIPADTAFTPPNLANTDCILALYHDQALPVIKYAGFGDAVNITLGLPFIRTSVDHGTAFDLAGTGRANAGSLRAALKRAIELGSQHGRQSTS